jgi:hypothetical protein
VFVVAVDPVHLHATIQQRRRQLIQRLRTLNVAEQNRRVWCGWQAGETGLDVMPVLVNITNENQIHAVPS